MRRPRSSELALALALAACGPNNNNGAASATGAGSTSGSGGGSTGSTGSTSSTSSTSSTGAGGGGPAQIGATVRISAPGGDASNPTLATDANGGWGLGYDQNIGQDGSAWFARIGADGKPNPAPAKVAGGFYIVDTQVRAGLKPGTFAIAWRDNYPADASPVDYQVSMALAPAGGPPGAPMQATNIAGFIVKSFDVAETPSGWVVAGCMYDGMGPATVFVQSAGAMTPTTTPNHCRQDGLPVRLVYDGSQLWLAWSEDVPQAAMRTNLQRVSAGGATGPVIRVTPDSGGMLVDVVVGQGEIAVVYYDDLLIHLARFDLQGKPKGAPFDLDPGAEAKANGAAQNNGSDVAFGAAGYVDAFWSQPHGQWQPTLQSRGPDGSKAGALAVIDDFGGEGEISLAPSGAVMGIAFQNPSADSGAIYFARADGL